MKTIITLIFILTSSSFIFGASFVVNSSGDTNDANLSDNLCLDASGNCTLRAAIQQSNAQAENDTITFASNISRITLSIGEILIIDNGSLTVNGRGADLLNVANTNNNSRVLRTESATLTIKNLTVSGGRIPNAFPQNGSGMLVSGGAVNLENVVFDDNQNSNGRQNPASGGGIYFGGGVHVIRNSTFSNNRAAGIGGGIYNTGNLTISNSTISGNNSLFSGGGIENRDAGNLDLFNVTIANNTTSASCLTACSAYGGGVSQNSSSTVRIANSIISGNTAIPRGGQPFFGPEIYLASGSALTSLGNNFIGDSADDSTNTGSPVNYLPTDIRDIPPRLATLGNYGGPTPTHALLSDSPAINSGNDANAPPLDQRGEARVGVSDIGAYEYNGSNLSISGRVTTNGTAGLSGVTVTLSGSSSATVITDSNGNYFFGNLNQGGSYTITPMLSGAVFTPANATFNNLSGSQTTNFQLQCNYSINPLSVVIPAGGGGGTVNVTTSPGCNWTATSNSSFITVTGGSSGTGSGTVSYTVAANPGAVRTGTITIAGQIFTITQNALPVLSVNNVSLFEGNIGTTPFVFTVSFNAASSQTVTVNYATVNGTATPPSDYQATSGTLSFAPGETSKTVTVLVNGDTMIEPNETFTVNLSGASGATIGNNGTGIIKNDDPVAAASTKFDYDGDGRSDVSVFRPSNGAWYLNRSTGGFIGIQFGISSDLIAPADFDGDGKTDLAVFRSSNGYWYFMRSSDNSFGAIQFGASGDIPLPADYDGDGKDDISVFRPSNGYWYRLNSTDGQFAFAQFGANGDVPVPGDYNGDGKANLAVFRPSTSSWYIARPVGTPSQNFDTIQFGISTDIPTPADYDGDGKTDVSVFRPSNGVWYRLNSTDGSFGFAAFGQNGDVPVSADYDGDGKANFAVFRPSAGYWYIARPTGTPSQNFDAVQFGTSTDKPTPAAFLR